MSYEPTVRAPSDMPPPPDGYVQPMGSLMGDSSDLLAQALQKRNAVGTRHNNDNYDFDQCKPAYVADNDNWNRVKFVMQSTSQTDYDNAFGALSTMYMKLGNMHDALASAFEWIGIVDKDIDDGKAAINENDKTNLFQKAIADAGLAENACQVAEDAMVAFNNAKGILDAILVRYG